MAVYYHYTSLRNYESMLEGRDFGRRGLLPVRRFVSLDLAANLEISEKASDGVSSGLLEPMPRAWLTKSLNQGDVMLETLLSPKLVFGEVAKIKIVVDKSDDIYVADYSPHFVKARAEENFLEHIKKTKTLYWQSLRPFFDYHENPCYIFPEVINFSAVPLERMHLARVFSDRTALFNEFRTAAGLPQLPKPQPLPDINLILFPN